jgi:ribosomal protein S1
LTQSPIYDILEALGGIIMSEKPFEGTNLGDNKGEEEFIEVENLIKETLAESQLINKKEEKTAPTPKVEEKKQDFQGTSISLPKEPKPAPQAAPAKPVEAKKQAPKTDEQKYEATFREYKVADIVKGTVLKVDAGSVLVDIKYKADGLIKAEELSAKAFTSTSEVVKVGDTIDVFIENLENKEGYVVLSKKRADEEVRWKIAYEAYKKKELLEGKVVQVLRGGLVLDCDGIRGFVPASQVLKKSNEELESFNGKVLAVKVIEIDHRQGKIVLSHKLAAGDKGKKDNEKIFNELEVGQVRHGVVSSLKSFGAFVDLVGIDGLIHLSELSWKRVKHPSELLKVGQDLDVFVLGVDKISKKVALGLKELQPDPWVEAEKHFKPGQVVKAKIARFAKFGAFAELDHNLEGLIHNTELAKQPVHNPGDAVKIGDTVDVKILRIIPEEQKIGLSIREVIIGLEKEDMKKANAGQPESKVTIGDIIAQKEKEKAEREAEEAEETTEETTAPAPEEKSEGTA